MVIQRSQRHRHRCRLERAAVRVEAAARGRIARQSIPPKAVPVSGAYCIPREADDVTGSDLDLTSLRGPVFKRSRGWPRYQLRYMYMSVDGAGQAALCHRASDAVGGGTGIEKQLPVASITAVHVESWGRCALTLAIALAPAPALALALTLALILASPSPSPSPSPPVPWSGTSSLCTHRSAGSPRAGAACIAQ